MRDQPPPKSLLERRTYTVRETAQILGMSQRWVLDKVNMGAFPSVRIGVRHLLLREHIDGLVAPPTPLPDPADAA